ncbi:MAG: hypothetical protein OEW00_03940, partial [candidate division Zixibacteria bacterium]|nr:hypothetical protein [candidate division Zixibacteria bacterium]
IEDDFCISSAGFFLGCRMRLATAAGQESVQLERDGDRLVGYATRRGAKIEQGADFKTGGFAVNNYFVDQLELFLAMRDFKVGDIIDEEIFVPLDVLASRIRGQIRDFAYLRLHSSLYDSVFVVTLTQPQRVDLFVTRDRRLVKASFPEQDVRAYLDAVRKPAPQPVPPPAAPVDIPAYLPWYALFVAVGIFSILFFIGQGYRRLVSYIGFLFGAALFLVVVITQIPAQKYLVGSVVIPGLRAGESLFVLGLLPSLTVGIIQEFLKLLGVFALAHLARIQHNRLTIVGSVCGAGFGVVEACYLITGMDLSLVASWSLIERAFLILFHATSGALLGYGLAHGIRQRAVIVTALVLVNSLIRYLPTFVQQQVLPLGLMYFASAFICLVLLFSATLVFRRAKSPGRAT